MKITVRDYYEERESDTLYAVADWACAQTNIKEYPEDRPLLFCDERQDILNAHVDGCLYMGEPPQKRY